MLEMKNLYILVLFAFSRFFQKPPGGAWTAARRHMCLTPSFLGFFMNRWAAEGDPPGGMN